MNRSQWTTDYKWQIKGKENYGWGAFSYTLSCDMQCNYIGQKVKSTDSPEPPVFLLCSLHSLLFLLSSCLSYTWHSHFFVLSFSHSTLDMVAG